jgi:sigma-E factor negative regulatory protein RseC
MDKTGEYGSTDFSAPVLVEGFAQVVALEGDMAWLVPEQTSSCGGCSASSACGSKGIGTLANRLEARRFQLVNDAGLRVGDRVVVGIRENALLRASITAYAIPLATLLIAGVLAQWWFGSDMVTMFAMVAGLVFGLWLARLRAGRLMARGDLAPRFLRRASMGETCNLG